MIQKLEIKNFQSHKHSVLEFDAGLNVIVGATDSGKTAILRAFNWLVNNKPSGNAFRSTWGGETSVVATIDGTLVSRIKDKTDSYIIKKQGKKAKELKAFGTGVPDVVTNFLLLDEVNIQKQLDSPFLLTESPGKVAQFFNKVANLDKIDSSISNINSEINKTKHSITFNENAIAEKENELNQYNNLPEIESLYRKAIRLAEKSNALEDKIAEAQGIITKTVNVRKEIDELSGYIELEIPVNKLLSLYEMKGKNWKEFMVMNNILVSIRKVNEQLKAQAETTMHEDLINEILALYDNKRKANDAIFDINDILRKILKVENLLSEKELTLTKLEDRWHEVKGTECPICGNKI